MLDPKKRRLEDRVKRLERNDRTNAAAIDMLVLRIEQLEERLDWLQRHAMTKQQPGGDS